MKPCKFDEKCNKGRFCPYRHTKWSKITKLTTVMNDPEQSTQFSPTDMSKSGDGAASVMEQLCKLYPGDKNLSSLTFAYSPAAIKEEIGEASLNNRTMVDLKKVSAILIELVEKELNKTEEEQVSKT